MRAICVLVALLFAEHSAAACTGCTPPSLTELAGAAEHVVAGTVESADKHEHSVIAVAAVWKGGPGKALQRTGCWRLFERVGSKVIVLQFPAGWTSKWVDECLGVYADTPANRATLTKLFGKPS